MPSRHRCCSLRYSQRTASIQDLLLTRNAAMSGTCLLASILVSTFALLLSDMQVEVNDGSSDPLHCRIRMAAVSESLSGADREAWEAVQQRVQSLGFDAAEAERMMVKAFGWGSQAYWRKSKVKEVPDVAKV